MIKVHYTCIWKKWPLIAWIARFILKNLSLKLPFHILDTKQLQVSPWVHVNQKFTLFKCRWRVIKVASKILIVLSYSAPLHSCSARILLRPRMYQLPSTFRTAPTMLWLCSKNSPTSFRFPSSLIQTWFAPASIWLYFSTSLQLCFDFKFSLYYMRVHSHSTYFIYLNCW